MATQITSLQDRFDKSTTRPFFRPRVVVKFIDSLDVPYIDGAEKVIGERYGFGPWQRLVERYGDLTLVRLYSSLAPEEIQELVDKASELDEGYHRPNLMTWFTIDCPDGVRAEELAKVLTRWEIVDRAYPDAPAEDPAVNAADDVRSSNQGYLDPAPDGINAEFAWTLAGGDGAGQRFVDVEQGWTLNHEDLNGHGASLLFGSLVNGSRPHGTAVLGEICAIDNTLGCVGIAPHIDSVDVASHSGSLSNVGNAIIASLPTLEFGHVIILEVQTVAPDPFGGPVEFRDDAYEAIRLATALGVVIVEAAGNGSQNLDTLTNAAGQQILNPLSPDFRDSGAIIVGAGSSTAPHTRLGFSSFGRRVNCYAWGENVDTCSSTSMGSTTLYTSSFNGTSSATPIITGAALSVQGAMEATLGYRLSPRQMRDVLSNPTTGTATSAPAVDLIGVMPDLQAIIQNTLNVGMADVFIRDNPTDVGDPHTGFISASPDIIVRPNAVADPQMAYGEGSGTESSMTLGYEVESGQDNFIYARVRNRGPVAAGGTMVSIYWSEVSTLVTPDMWNFIGQVMIPSVPTGSLLTVSNGLTWPSGDIPATGHYCFVGLTDTAGDPAPLVGNLSNFDNFTKLIQNNNNVTWRNFNVVNNTPNPADPGLELQCLVAGAPDRAAMMGVDVMAQLPESAKLWLEAPLFLLRGLGVDGEIELIDNEHGRIRCHPHGTKRLGEMRFPAKLRAHLRMFVEMSSEDRKQSGYQVVAKQFYVPEKGEELEVGRVAWHLVSPEFLKQRQRMEDCLWGK